jgi:hypothetical protein
MADSESENGRRRDLRAWWRGTKPTDVLSVVFTICSLAIAALALVKADQATHDQQALQNRVEEEQSTPILLPGTPLSDRGKVMTVFTEFAHVHKRLDRLFLDRAAGRFVIPIRNGGTGNALTVGLPLLVPNCIQEPRLLPAEAVGALGAYVITSGESDQLGYVQPPKPTVALPTAPRGGYVYVRGKRLWYNWDYSAFDTKALQPPNLLIWYTDAAEHLLRWTCVSYTHTKVASEWAVSGQTYGSRTWPQGSKRFLP